MGVRTMSLRIGPGAMVAAAFIGPGTVTTASVAGATSGITLMWAVAFSVLATLVLQELSLRSALATQQDLATLVREMGSGHWWGPLLVVLIIAAIGVGNAAYQSGNLSGAGIGLSAVLPVSFPVVVAIAASLAAALIVLDHYRWLERLLVSLVALMALLFSGLAVLVLPLLLLQSGERLMPAFSVANLNLALALVGTTVVPYNLFLHATAVRRRWQGEPVDSALRGARKESMLAILIGGGITFSIMIVAAALIPSAPEQEVLPALMAAIDSQFPGGGTVAVGVGLFAAGLTSAIAAPIAAGWAVCGALGWSTSPGSRGFKAVALLVLVVGTLFAVVTTRPAVLIVTAQITNALLLPVIAVILVALANSELLPERFRNRGSTNLLAIAVLVIVGVLALTKLAKLLV